MAADHVDKFKASVFLDGSGFLKDMYGMVWYKELDRELTPDCSILLLDSVVNPDTTGYHQRSSKVHTSTILSKLS